MEARELSDIHQFSVACLRSGGRRVEPPTVAFWVSGSVLPKSVRLVGGFSIDVGACGFGTSVVIVNIRDLNGETSVGSCASRGVQVVFGGNPVEPDDVATERDLSMYDGAIVESLEPARGEAEHLHEVAVARLDVVVHQHRRDLR